jgi:threonine aldolase
VETNIVVASLARCELDGPALAARLAEHAVGVLALEPRALRFVVHRDVGPEDVARLERALDAILGPSSAAS